MLSLLFATFYFLFLFFIKVLLDLILFQAGANLTKIINFTQKLSDNIIIRFFAMLYEYFDILI